MEKVQKSKNLIAKLSKAEHGETGAKTCGVETGEQVHTAF